MSPLIKGKSERVRKENQKEFKTGPTYAHTKAKFGKKRAEIQAYAVAKAQQRKSS